MRFASWNVNGIRARADRVDHWLTWRAPEVLALQELRCPDRSFPRSLFADAGYHVERLEHAALASIYELTDVVDLLGDGRALLATSTPDAVRTASIYAPNGTKAGTERHRQKLDWFDALLDALVAELDHGGPVLLMGDLNIAHDDRDVWAPEKYQRRNLFTRAERDRLDRLVALGFTDLFRHHHAGHGAYTWWNYAHDSFNRNRGWRLDYLLASAPLVTASSHVVIDVEERNAAGTSDHAPLWVDLAPIPS